MQARYLLLENGRIFEGFAFGAGIPARDPTIGEVVFTTNMAGFTETLTDPSFDGQIVAQTFPLVGCYGVNPADFESLSERPFAKGYIVKEWCEAPSHFACGETLDSYLKRHGIPGLWRIDTRALTKLIRKSGVLRGAICDDPANIAMEGLKGYQISDAMGHVSVQKPVFYPSDFAVDAPARQQIVVWDFGVRRSTVQWLNGSGYDVKVIPGSWTAEQILAEQLNGIVLSNGPGNPEEYGVVVEELKKLIQKGIAIFGIGMGHQLLALANGGLIEKLPYGHRGGSPVRDLKAGCTFITDQNHGYAVRINKLPRNAIVRYQNAYDGTCEGLDYDNGNFSVQFHPEACGSSRDAEFLFNRFAALINSGAMQGSGKGGRVSCH